MVSLMNTGAWLQATHWDVKRVGTENGLGNVGCLRRRACSTARGGWRPVGLVRSRGGQQRPQLTTANLGELQGDGEATSSHQLPDLFPVVAMEGMVDLQLLSVSLAIPEREGKHYSSELTTRLKTVLPAVHRSPGKLHWVAVRHRFSTRPTHDQSSHHCLSWHPNVVTQCLNRHGPGPEAQLSTQRRANIRVRMVPVQIPNTLHFTHNETQTS